jgi:peptidoglycan/xylan/chitin deacetylase (PgdA/CDA1 family)
VLTLLIFDSVIYPDSFSQIQDMNTTKCNCVIFRLDDIQDNYLNKSQLALLNLFLIKNDRISLGIIGNYIGNDSSLVNKINEGYHKGLFELASHGWNHENFTKLSEQNQSALMLKTNKKLQNLFETQSLIFIPPSFDFNKFTLDAMGNLGIRVISSFDRFYVHDNQSYLITKGINSDSADDNKIFHFPTTVQYSYFDSDSKKWNTYPVKQALLMIDRSISKYGYAVITLHPQAFTNSQDGNLTNSVNATQLSNLKQLIDSIASRNIQITSFYKLSGITNVSLVNLNISIPEIKNLN